jgi:BolA-like protein 3
MERVSCHIFFATVDVLARTLLGCLGEFIIPVLTIEKLEAMASLPFRRITMIGAPFSARVARPIKTLSRTADIFPRPLPAPRPRAYTSEKVSLASSASSAPTSSPTRLPPKPTHLDAAESEIWNRLSLGLAPSELSVEDVSGGCGSMYSIEIASQKFKGQSVLQQQRMVNGVIADLVKGWHGLQLKTRIP